MIIEHVLVVGAGVMGRGIAQWFAGERVHTAICDCDERLAHRARETIVLSWKKRLSKGKIQESDFHDYKKYLTVCSLESLNPQTDLAVEAVFEDQDTKIKVFKKLEEKLPKAVLATNTSSLSISAMAKDLQRKSRFIGLHFFNPAFIMKLVEIIPGVKTERDLALQLKHWFDEKGKKAAICKDSPGFIVNRVARNFYGEALSTVKNISEVAEHDCIMREVGGFKMGPFELMDLIGIDINYQVTTSVWKSYYREPRFAPHPLQRMMVESGRLGRKSGEGFYSYDANIEK